MQVEIASKWIQSKSYSKNTVLSQNGWIKILFLNVSGQPVTFLPKKQHKTTQCMSVLWFLSAADECVEVNNALLLFEKFQAQCIICPGKKYDIDFLLSNSAVSCLTSLCTKSCHKEKHGKTQMDNYYPNWISWSQKSKLLKTKILTMLFRVLRRLLLHFPPVCFCVWMQMVAASPQITEKKGTHALNDRHSFWKTECVDAVLVVQLSDDEEETLTKVLWD